MKSQELRKSFIDYFVKQHGHTEVPSAPVIPHGDPTLLFTNAGMNQFKPIFLDQAEPVSRRVVNSQKCIRVSGKHNDLEEVGKDDYHHTFFEMLGNWSFGDYYKAEAIEWAWILLTREWGLSPERLFASVYLDDDESYALWKKISGLPKSHILRFDEKDNFWEMGNTGPCGPCSEIHYYRGSLKDTIDPGLINSGDPRYIELWNLVFMQYFRDEEAKLHPLSKKHVDTGAGFERLLCSMNGFSSNYDTDVFQNIIRQIEAVSGKTYNNSPDSMAHRVIADHLRMLSFSIADGALPSNEGRGYVLRRILRRAARYGKKIGLNDPFIFDLVPVLIDTMGDAYPELKKHASHISKVIRSEEKSFLQTLDRGLAIFEETVLQANKKGTHVLPGSQVFKLYDTFGFPVDLTRLLAEEKGLRIDEEGFNRLMNKQKERARTSGRFKSGSGKPVSWRTLSEKTDDETTRFVGYDTLDCSARLRKWAYVDGKTLLVFDKSPFYAESGGQIGDSGQVIFGDKEYHISDTRKEGERFIHVVDEIIPEKNIRPEVRLYVLENRRLDTARNHTATHLLHAALQKVLGTHVRQAGSYVGPDYLRFDFHHFEKVAPEELKKIQNRVNEEIFHNIPLNTEKKSFREAVDQGAMALFGEKYGEVVRTVKIGDFSFELCGGTHVRATGDIGYMIILSESSIASGIRRIEAVTGKRALEYLSLYQEISESLSARLKSHPKELTDKIDELLEMLKSVIKERDELKSRLIADSAEDYLKNPQNIEDMSVYTAIVPVESMDQLKQLGDKIRQKLQSGIAVLGIETGTGPQILCVVTDDLVKQGIHAGKIVKKIGQDLGGGGGGRPHMATAGGKKSGELNRVLENIKDYIK
jgi:alanyl-tRNA synthetase